MIDLSIKTLDSFSDEALKIATAKVALPSKQGDFIRLINRFRTSTEGDIKYSENTHARDQIDLLLSKYHETHFSFYLDTIAGLMLATSCLEESEICYISNLETIEGIRVVRSLDNLITSLSNKRRRANSSLDELTKSDREFYQRSHYRVSRLSSQIGRSIEKLLNVKNNIDQIPQDLRLFITSESLIPTPNQTGAKLLFDYVAELSRSNKVESIFILVTHEGSIGKTSVTLALLVSGQNRSYSKID